ncbi:MAG: RsmB/NOP family class I SAM-dependent RNA methyltransferase [Planctomycetota bacterium]|jgi:16S rRNA (cytosine967-C5)-methyltransferase
MSASLPKSARAVAAQVLRQFSSKQAHAGPILNRLLPVTDEKQRATDLVFGTIRNLRAIDAVITTFSGRRIERITRALLAVIRVGVYELVYNPQSPPYSVVSEAVNTAKEIGGRKQTGFVNAVLREVLRHITGRQIDLSVSHPMRTLIQTPQFGCEFDTDLLPDPELSLAAYLSTGFSLPQWLVEDWLSEFGPERTRQICFGSNRRPSVYLRVNPLRTTGADLSAQFESAAVHAENVVWESDTSGPGCEILKVTGPQAVPQLPGFAEGLFTVQDIAACHAVCLLDPQPDWRILDLCAAPGTKTTQLAELTRDTARIVATDIDADRLEMVRQNLARLSLRSIDVVPYAQCEQETVEPFDAILLDVPCSNTGVLAKRVEVRYRITADSLHGLAKTQRGLLEKAATLVKPGGRICYSTCSIQRAEDRELVHEFLEANRQFAQVRHELILPSADDFDHDGAYVAILAKNL